MISLIHTADWQLGKPFGRFPADVRASLTEARFDVIDRIGALADARGIQHVVVAGDVFDNTDPGDRVVVQAITRMARAGCRWWLLPGNHDHARADGLWSRVRTRAPENIRVVDKLEAVEMEEEAWLLPAPLEYRRTRDDPTTAFSEMVTPSGAVRIGLAHGSVTDFAGKGEADNFIPPDRAKQSDLDYLALGDWHGHVAIGDRTAYSGTPETDRFGRDDAGSVIIAEVARGAAPSLERVTTGKYRWLSHMWDITGFVDFDREARTFTQGQDLAATLLDLKLSGSASLADRVAIHGAVNDELAHALRWLACNDVDLVAKPTADDIANIDVQGTLAMAASALQGKIDAGGADAALAGRALERLYVEAIRAQEGRSK